MAAILGKEGVSPGLILVEFFCRDLACQGSHWTPNLLFIENVRVYVNSSWTTIDKVEQIFFLNKAPYRLQNKIILFVLVHIF